MRAATLRLAPFLDRPRSRKDIQIGRWKENRDEQYRPATFQCHRSEEIVGNALAEGGLRETVQIWRSKTTGSAQRQETVLGS